MVREVKRFVKNLIIVSLKKTFCYPGIILEH